MKKPPSKSSLTKKLDKAFSILVRKVGKCEKCGKKENLQCCHIFSRANRSTRWFRLNAFCLCGGCHLFWGHKNPVEFTEWTKERLGINNYEELRREAKSTKKWSVWEMEELLKNLEAQNELVG